MASAPPRWRALLERARALQFRGDPDAVEVAHEAASAAEDDEGEHSLALFEAWGVLAGAYLGRGDAPRAIRFEGQALRLGERIGAPRAALAVCSSFLAYGHLLRGDVEPAVEEAERALQRAQELEPQLTTKVLGNTAAVFAGAKDDARALALYARLDDALAPQDVGDGDVALEARVDRGIAKLNAARSAMNVGRADEAERSLLAALDRMEAQWTARLRPADEHVAALRSSWAQLVEGGHVPGVATEAVEARLRQLERPAARP